MTDDKSSSATRNRRRGRAAEEKLAPAQSANVRRHRRQTGARSRFGLEISIKRSSGRSLRWRVSDLQKSPPRHFRLKAAGNALALLLLFFFENRTSGRLLWGFKSFRLSATSATSCWQTLRIHLNKVSSSLESARLMVPNVVFTRSRWGCWEQGQAQPPPPPPGRHDSGCWGGVTENIMSNHCYHW